MPANITVNIIKLCLAFLLALACIIALVVEPDSDPWAIPTLTLVVGYVIGNARITDVRPIFHDR